MPDDASPQQYGDTAALMSDDPHTVDRNSSTSSLAVQVPIDLGGETGHIFAELRVPPGATTVQVLIHGWASNRKYFDPPAQSHAPSYVRAANHAGYATLAIDRVGSGCSHHPASLVNTFDNQVRAVAKCVDALRSGMLGAMFDKVIAVGDCVGGIIATQLALRYSTVNAVVTTGQVHTDDYAECVSSIPNGRVASIDKSFASIQLDALYMTSIPENETDDKSALRDTDSIITLATMLSDRSHIGVDDIDVPVLSITNQNDDTSTHRGHSAIVEHLTVPNSSRNVFVTESSTTAINHTIDFCDRHVGNGAGISGSIPGSSTTCDQPKPIHDNRPHSLANRALVSMIEPVIDNHTELIRSDNGNWIRSIDVSIRFLTEVDAIITRVTDLLSEDVRANMILRLTQPGRNNPRFRISPVLP